MEVNMSSPSMSTLLEFDERGDLVIRIPRSRLLQNDPNRIALAIETMLARPDRVRTEADWDSDPWLDLVGRFEADVSDGSERHDRDLYLERRP
jgi:hypothetical protein